MWIRYSETLTPIPVRYEVKGWDNLIGAHYDHYHLDYNSYSNAEISNDIFSVNEGIESVAYLKKYIYFSNMIIIHFIFY